MNLRKFTLVACIGGLFITLPIWVANISVSKLAQPKPSTQMSVEQVQQQAQTITVKVMSSDVLGTGIILQKQGSVYTVITTRQTIQEIK